MKSAMAAVILASAVTLGGCANPPPRVGGSPADAQFRAAQQASGKRYQEARTTCRAKPSAERTGCVTAAKTELKQAQAEAEATHDAAKKAR